MILVKKKAKNEFILGLALVIISCFDFYYFGVRIFDFAGVTLLILRLTRTGNAISQKTGVILFGYTLLFLWVFSISNNLVRYITGDSIPDITGLKSILGYTLCFFVFFIVAFSKFNSENILNIINVILIFHGFCLGLQFVVYYASGTIINFVPNIENRLLSSVFRPAGMFLEPAHYSLVLFLFLVLRYLILPRIDRIFFFSLLTMLLSLSMWGMLGFLFLVLNNLIVSGSIKKLTYFVLLLLFLTGVVIYLYNVNDSVKLVVNYTVLERLDRIATNKDNSVAGRIGTSPFGGDEIQYENVFGQGFTSSIKYGGANLFSLIVNNFGIVGSVLFYLTYFIGIPKTKIYFVIFSLFIVSTATHALFSSFIFWTWLALVLRIARDEYERVTS